MADAKRIGFVSFRFAGTDGVSLEASKWAELLWYYKHVSYWFAGELDRDASASMLVPEAHFEHPEAQWINARVFGVQHRSPEVTERIHAMRAFLKQKLYDFVERFAIEILVPQNVLAIPMNIPLALALTEFIAETEIPTIAHHHDFFWERQRFSVSAVQDLLRWAFPPALPNVQHVVINSPAREALALRTGISSTVIPNVLDFERPPGPPDDYTKNLRRDIGLGPEDFLFLQPTRVVQRKGIEHAIELVHRLADPRIKLVISHEAGDEGHGYGDWLMSHAKRLGVDLRIIAHIVGDRRGVTDNGERRYTLWDIYPHADFITYPSLYEGFGNAFLEAIYFRKPMLVNRYGIFAQDIEPLGFDLVTMDGYVTDEVVDQVRQLLASPRSVGKMVRRNFALARRHYGYKVLRKRLAFLIGNFFGMTI